METVVRLRRQMVADPYSGEDTGEVWPSDDDPGVPVTGWLVEPRPDPEAVQDARNAVVNGYTLYRRGEAPDITEYDRVRVRGKVYAVDGAPAVWAHQSTGETVGVVVQCKKVTG